MASKKSTVYVVDRGESMGHCHNGRTQTDLEWGMKYITDDIGNRILSERKTDCVGVVSVTGDASTCVESKIKQFLFDDYQALRKLEKAGLGEGDLADALIQAIDLTIEGTSGVKGNKLKYERMIILLTNAHTPISFESGQWREAFQKLKEWEIDVRVLVIDKPDDNIKLEDGIKVEGNPNVIQNIQKLEELCQAIGRESSFIASYEEAIWSMSRPKPREVAVLARAYTGTLTLGDTQAHGSQALSINITTYPMTRVATAVSAKSFAEIDGQLYDVGIVPDYVLEEKNKSETAVARDKIEAGYPYGSEIIPVSEVVEQLLGEFNTNQSMQIVGFVDADRVDRWALMGQTDFVVATKDRDSLALSSFVRAMYEEDKRAVARFVRKDNSTVQMVLLSPYFDIEFECLVMCPLPFADDYRKFNFPALDKCMSRYGKELPTDNEQRIAREPTQEMLSHMEAVVDCLDLMDVDMGQEFAIPEDTFNPVIHRVKQAIKECALSGDTENLPETLPILLEVSRPPAELVERSKEHLDKLRELFDLKRVEKRKTLKEEAAEMEAKLKAPKQHLDLDLLFA